MRMYAHQVSHADLRIDVLPIESIEAEWPDPASESVAAGCLIWRRPPLLVNGQPCRLTLEMRLYSGALSLQTEGGARYEVLKGRDSDRLRLMLYHFILDSWYGLAQHEDISRAGLEMIGHMRSQVFRLEDSLERPDNFLYQFL